MNPEPLIGYHNFDHTKVREDVSQSQIPQYIYRKYFCLLGKYVTKGAKIFYRTIAV
jgi:hypothetical protein